MTRTIRHLLGSLLLSMVLACVPTARATTRTLADSLARAGSTLHSASSSVLETRFVYDPKSDRYLLTTFLDGKPFGTPTPYTFAEYLRYQSRQGQARYWDTLNAPPPATSLRAGKAPTRQGKRTFIDHIFGPGGLRLKLQGQADLSAGGKTIHSDNPALPQSARRQTYFDFDEKIQAGVQASLGTKLQTGLNYNSASTFDFAAKRLRLAFEGEEDDIIKLIEVGNVSMNPRNSLISGGGSLFGLHTKLQLGRLEADLLLSQQRTESRRASSRGGEQTEPFELSASSYDALRHFFLSDFFRTQYDRALSSLPYVRTSVQITRLEVWVTNRRGRFDDARDVAAFADLGEPQRLHNSFIQPSAPTFPVPANSANSLYAALTSSPTLRQLSALSTGLPALRPALDYERIERARRLSPSEYTLHNTLGYISLTTPLAADEVLAVAYEFTYEGKVYRVGEFASDQAQSTSSLLFVKLLKGTDFSPKAPTWSLMMRNVYRLGAGITSLQRSGFQLDVLYRDEATGRALPYLPDGPLKGKQLLRILGLDRLDSQQEAHSDGRFDFVEGYTIRSSEGLVFFPTTEPFGATLTSALGGGSWASRYAFPELYSMTAVEAAQRSEKNKYYLRGSYRATTAGEIALGAVNVTPGSVRVTAGGAPLAEGIDYTVDYTIGRVKILNRQLLDAKTPIEVSLHGGDGLSQQRKTLIGLDLNYRFSPDLRLGATLMHFSELPLTTKAALGQESLRNTMWGANLSYQSKLPRLTSLLNRLPFVDLTQPASLTLSAEMAQLLPGHYKSKYSDGSSYLDDFDAAHTAIELMSPQAWRLASTPATLIPEGADARDFLRYGERRARLAWFTIDPLFTRTSSSYTPAYLRSDPDFVSRHLVRDIPTSELYPNREVNASLPSYLPTFSLSFYPDELGPYNLNAQSLTPTGKIREARKSWGGIMRKIDQTDFEAAGVEYLEFWLMDPYADEGTPPAGRGGDLYIDLGDISEDILHDERRFYESGLPLTPQPGATATTPWGIVPTRPSAGYAFDNAAGAREKQDVGLNGLSSSEERQHPSYTAFLNALRTQLSPTTLQQWQADPQSLLNDPAGDDFHHYRGADYDAQRLPILQRYKYYNGTEGNSSVRRGGDGYSTAATVTPDTEDINGDYSMNELNRYYEWKISLRPEDLVAGRGFITSSRRVEVELRNGKTSPVTWYQFKVPLSAFTNRIGGMSDLRSVRFMRLFLSGFERETQLRFASLRLVRGDWRTYIGSLDEGTPSPSERTHFSVTSVNIEEHADRSPVSYTLPPGVSRSIDAQGSQSLQQNEQALSLRLEDLPTGESRAVYRRVQYDLRRYRRLQLFAHAEALLGDLSGLEDGDMTLFVRLGSDYTQHYYEYSLPLTLTPAGRYSSLNPSDRRRVWPDANCMDLRLDDLISLKRSRNTALGTGAGSASLYRPFSRPDATNPTHTLTVLGNPTLANVRALVIGVRNRSGQTRSVEVWVNELRASDYHEEAGWAGQVHSRLQLGELGEANLRAQYTSAGFGAIDAPLMSRTLESRRSFQFASSLEVGQLLPPEAKLSLPVYYTVSDEVVTPQYNPLDEDVKLSAALSDLPTERAKKELRARSLTHRRSQGLSLSKVSVGIRSSEPMPYDPANLSLSYGRNTSTEETPDIEYSHHLDWHAALRYDYAPTFQPLRPFAKVSGASPWADFLRQYTFTPWPSRLVLETSMLRRYDEEQLRSLGDGLSDTRLPATFAQQFIWNRRLQLNWNPTRSLQFALTSGTDARIEEPHVQVNRQLQPDTWRIWRDSVEQSIRQGGTPVHYAQQASLSYQLPTADIAPLSFIRSQLSYSSAYSWDRGAVLPDPNIRLAHTLSAQGALESTTQLQLRQLYQHIPALARLEQRFGSGSKVSTTRTKGKASGSDLLDRLLYALLMVKDVALTYRTTRSTLLPGFLPTIRAIGGQGSSAGVLTPGVAFSLGLSDANFIDQLAQRGDLLVSTEHLTPGVFTQTRTIDLRATLQPFAHLSITLTGNHTRTDRTEVQYMYAGRPRLYGGDFTMTTIGLKGFFAPLRSEAGYRSETFASLLELRELFVRRQEAASGLGGKLSLDHNAPAALIPAFRATYMYGAQRGKKGLTALPNLLGMLPNWSVSYTGLGDLPFLKRHFRNVTLRHTYRATYTVGGFSSLAGWQGAHPDAVGVLSESGASNSGTPSSQRISYAYDIPSVALQESFFPLIGLEMTWLNGVGMSTQWRQSRGAVLHLGSRSLIEALSRELSLYLTYKIDDFSSLISPTTARRRKRRTTQAPSASSTHGLTLKGEYAHRRTLTLLRQIEEGYTQATSGIIDQRLRLSAAYELSRQLSLEGYYEYSRNVPLVSSYSFPISTSSYGLSLRVTLDN